MANAQLRVWLNLFKYFKNVKIARDWKQIDIKIAIKFFPLFFCQ